MSDVFTWAWVGWLLAFAVTEAGALVMDKRKPRGDANANGVHDDGFTLSAHLRAWFRVDTAHGRTAFLASFMLFAGTFLLHIVTGAWLGR